MEQKYATVRRAFKHAANYGLGLSGLAIAIMSQLGISLTVSLLVICCIMLAATLISLQILNISSRVDKLRWDTDKGGGDCLVKHVRGAKRGIFTTHFAIERPSQHYVDELIDKLNHGIKITRLVHKIPDEDEQTYAWLKQFEDHDASYIQYEVPFRLPFNIVIIDNRIVWLFFPTDHDDRYYRKALWVQSEKLALAFTEACLRLNSYAQHKPKNHHKKKQDGLSDRMH